MKNSLSTFRIAMLFNGFMYVDETMEAFMLKAIKVYEKYTETKSDLPFIFFDSIARQGQKAKKMEMGENIHTRFEKNPISLTGRIFLLKGCLESVNLLQNVQNMKIPLAFYHSKNNNIVNTIQRIFFLKTTFSSPSDESICNSISQFLHSSLFRISFEK